MPTASDKYRVLFFIRGMAPSPEQYMEGQMYGPHCGYRNVLAMDMNGSLEDCDAVAGFVPPRYAAAYPKAVTITEWFARKLERPRGPVSSPVGGKVTIAPSPSVDPFLSPAQPAASGAGKAPNWQPQG